MRRLLPPAAMAALLLAAPAWAQDAHAGHAMPAEDPHAGHVMPEAATGEQPADPHAAHGAPEPDPHAGHAMGAPGDGHADHGAAPTPEDADAPPPAPTDFDADRHFPKAAMDAARARLRAEHGRILWSRLMFEKLELRPGSNPLGYAWEGKASFGGDRNRLVVKSRGEGDRSLERGEVDVLYGRAVSPWFNLEAGARQDLQRRGRSYLTVGVDGSAPYQFDVGAALFLSTQGDLGARIEAAHDYWITQTLVVEPRGEFDLAADAVRSRQVGAGLSRMELGLRLRYAARLDLAPYVGIEHERAVGETARLIRAAGGRPRDTRLVVGLRTWF